MNHRPAADRLLIVFVLEFEKLAGVDYAHDIAGNADAVGVILD